MSTWVWEGGEPSACPLRALQSALGTTVTHTSEGWSLPARGVLCEWMRWCALRVIHLWDCPDGVIRYLQTGDEALRGPANRSAVGGAGHAALAATRHAAWAAEWASRDHEILEAARSAARDAARAEGWAAAKPKSKTRSRSVARTAARDDARDAQARHLEVLLRAQRQLVILDPEFQALRRGGPEERAVLRDIALQREMRELALLLLPRRPEGTDHRDQGSSPSS